MPDTTNYSLHTTRTLGLYFKAIMRYPYDAALCLLLPVANALVGVAVPFFASKVLASMVAHTDTTWQYFAWFVGSAVIGISFNIVGMRRCMKLQAQVMEDLHNDVLAHLLERSVGFYNNQIGGKLVADALSFVTSFSQLFTAGFIGAGSFLVTTVIGLVVVTISSWQIGLGLCLLFIILGIWTYKESQMRSGLRSARLKISRRLTAHLSDTIVNAVTVKTFAQEHAEMSSDQRINTKLTRARLHDWLRTITNENARMGMLLFIQICLLFTLIALVRHDPQLLATGIFAFTYTLTLINRFFTISTMTRVIEDAFLEASPITELLSLPIEITDQPNARPLHVSRGEIVCRTVTFHYSDASSQDSVFEHLDLTIPAGQKVGLVGHSGGGKSTLTRLLLRFEDITEGALLIDGQDIRQVTQASLRSQIAYVPQEPLMFHRSIRDNLSYGKPQATEQEIMAATKQAFAYEFIMDLPQGYDTMVGERGVKLSGGQRQRIAIARAILKDAPILILDEATSALDSESEGYIQEALQQLMQHKTTLVIAHRLSTVQKMDRIIVMENGAITEDGSHKTLLKHKGTYAQLWAHQSGGFMKE